MNDTPILICRHCGDSFHGPVRDCPSPDAGREPYKDSGRGGHRFDPPATEPRAPMSPDRLQEIRAMAALGHPATANTLAGITPSTLGSALTELLAEYDALEAERKRLGRCILEDAAVDGVKVFSREQIDRIMGAEQAQVAAPTAEAMKCIAWCPEDGDESTAREYVGTTPGEVAEQHAELVYYEQGTQRECYEVRVRATKADLVREWDVVVDVQIEVSFSGEFVFPRSTSAKSVEPSQQTEPAP